MRLLQYFYYLVNTNIRMASWVNKKKTKNTAGVNNEKIEFHDPYEYPMAHVSTLSTL